MTKKQALKLIETKWWENKTSNEIVKFQLFEERLCMPLRLFHKAIENVLKRPVATHEFAFMKYLQKEFLGEKEKPTMEEIIDLIPECKQILIVR